jgi:hypothetical protein
MIQAVPVIPFLYFLHHLLTHHVCCCCTFYHTSAGQKGSDVTAREATRKMVSAATQLDALEKVAARVDAIAAANGVQVQHMQRPHQLPAAGTAAGAADAAEQEQEGMVPRSASAVVQPNLWQPKNTIVRGAFKESVATRTGMLAAVAAGVPMGQSLAGGNAAAAAAGMSGGVGASMGGAAAAGMVGKADMLGSGAAAAAGVGGGDAAARRLVGPDVLLAAMQQQQMLTQSADQECRIDQSHKQHRGR